VELETPAPKYFKMDIVLNDEVLTTVYVPPGAVHVKSSFDEHMIPPTKELKLEGVLPAGIGFVTVQLVGASVNVVNQTGLFRMEEL